MLPLNFSVVREYLFRGKIEYSDCGAWSGTAKPGKWYSRAKLFRLQCTNPSQTGITAKYDCLALFSRAQSAEIRSTRSSTSSSERAGVRLLHSTRTVNEDDGAISAAMSKLLDSLMLA